MFFSITYIYVIYIYIKPSIFGYTHPSIFALLLSKICIHVQIMILCPLGVLLFFKIFIFERERERASRRGAERQGDRGSEVGSALTAASLMWGLNS